MKEKTFLDNLSKIRDRFDWTLKDGCIRTFVEENEISETMCPLEALYWSKNSNLEGDVCWADAAEDLKINRKLTLQIINAADREKSRSPLRKKMLRRLGLLS